jgi:uncharacterized membrane-anchored protein YhcB (DUF1043 family)
MTDLRTRPVDEHQSAAAAIRTATRGKLIVLALIIGIFAMAIGVLVGWLVFNGAGPSRAELEQARWQQVVDYYDGQYQTMADAQARTEAYWQEVINHYARQYELIASAGSQPATDRQSAHWEAVVEYYEQRLE